MVSPITFHGIALCGHKQAQTRVPIRDTFTALEHFDQLPLDQMDAVAANGVKLGALATAGTLLAAGVLQGLFRR